MSAFLAGCASLHVERDAGIVRDGFELVGRVAVHNGSDGASGRIVWRHSPATDEMLITSPLGQGIARVTRRGAEVTLVTADQKEYEASDAESLTERVLGWRLPLAGLPDWVQGRADPARPAQLAHDAQSRLSELIQDDWRVEYQEYEGSRPSKLRISRAGLEIRLVVDQWVASQ
jgi:outer membrane lipoprotein LolB